MNNLVSKLRKIGFLHRLHLWYWGWREFLFINGRQILKVRRNYAERIKAVRAKYGREKLRVVFLVAEPAKWKSQSIYDLMKESDRYDPYVAVTAMDDYRGRTDPDVVMALMEERAEYFKKCGCNTLIAFDKKRGVLPLSEFSPDIVWYTQPWMIEACQDPSAVSEYALTCYTPYFVQNYGGLEMDCLMPFHRFLWRHFTLNEAWAKAFMRAQGFRRAGSVVGCGHPMLDQFVKGSKSDDGREYVIYAPHFSINQCESFATIHKNGEKILALAKRHPEIKWIFKPHPNLRPSLEWTEGWNKEKTDAYYREWEKIATACYDGTYAALFAKARLMITDCASFLVEFACTKQPIIRLISSNARFEPHPIARSLFDTYYAAHNWDEFEKWFEVVALKKEDPNREARLAAVRRMNLLDTHVAKDTLDYLAREFGKDAR